MASNDRGWIGFDLGGTKMLATVFDGEFKPLGKERSRSHGFLGAETGLARIAETVEAAMDHAGTSRKKIAGLGIGCPGPLDLAKGVIRDAPNLGWSNVAVKEYLEAHFGFPVVICNDVDAGVYGEYRFGAGRNARCLLGVFPGTGIGGGCVMNGELLTGDNASCMEIGHIRVVSDGPICGCGKRGCLETVASRLAVSAFAAQAAYRGQAPNLKDACGTDIANIRSGALCRAIKKGDSIIRDIVQDAARRIGIALGGVINLLSPDVIVLGGGMVEAMPEIIVPAATKSVKSSTMASLSESFRIVPAELGDDASVMGAAAWARHLVSSGAK